MEFDGRDWKSHGAKDGLLGNQVFDVAIDSGGTAWFVTDLGIASYDGEHWHAYPLGVFCGQPSCNPDRRFGTIAVGPDDSVWFTLHMAGLFRFVDGQWQRYENDLLFDDYYPVGNMCFTPDGRLWMGKWSDHDVSLFYSMDNTWHIPRIRGQSGAYTLPATRVNHIACASDNSVWFVSASTGVGHYIP